MLKRTVILLQKENLYTTAAVLFCVHLWFHTSVAFVLSLLAPNLSFFWCLESDVFVVVAFPGYLHLYFWIKDHCIAAMHALHSGYNVQVPLEDQTILVQF